MSVVDLAIVLDHAEADCGVKIRYFNLLKHCQKMGVRTAVIADAPNGYDLGPDQPWLNIRVSDQIGSTCLKRRPFIGLARNGFHVGRILDAIMDAHGVSKSQVLDLDAWSNSKEWVQPTTDSLCRFLDRVKPANVHIATESFLGFAATQVVSHAATTAFHTDYASFYAVRLLASTGRDDNFRSLCELINARIEEVFKPFLSRVFVSSHNLSQGLRPLLKEVDQLIDFPGGVDTQLFMPNGCCLRRRLRLLVVGRLTEEKGVRVIAEVYKRVTVKLDWLIIGDGADRNWMEKAMPTATFLGRVSQKEVAAQMAQSDIMLFPGLYDTFGLVALEAMACGVPVLTTRDCGIAPLIAHSKSGVVVDADPSALASALLELADSQSARREMGERGRAAAEIRTWEKACDRFLRDLGLVRA